MSLKSLSWVLCLFAAVLFVTEVNAQTVTGSIKGNIVDTTGGCSGCFS